MSTATSKKIDPGEVRFFSGTSNPALAAKIANYLGVPLERTTISRFSNYNFDIQLGKSVRSRMVFIVQSLSPFANEHLMQLLMMLDIAKSASAREIHAIIPYYSFARADVKDAPRISITARLVADLIKAAGATHIMTMMLHSPQVHGFFSIPADPLSSRPVFKRYLEKKVLPTTDISKLNTIVVSPDIGQAKSAARFARDLDLPVATGNIKRHSAEKVELIGTLGHEIDGFKRALIYDDEVATGSTVLEMTLHLKKRGIQEVWMFCTHGVFCKGGLARLISMPEISKIVTTDTVAIPPEKMGVESFDTVAIPSEKPNPKEWEKPDKLEILSVAKVFGKAIKRNYFRESIGDLFEHGKKGKNVPRQSTAHSSNNPDVDVQIPS